MWLCMHVHIYMCIYIWARNCTCTCRCLYECFCTYAETYRIAWKMVAPDGIKKRHSSAGQFQHRGRDNCRFSKMSKGDTHPNGRSEAASAEAGKSTIQTTVVPKFRTTFLSRTSCLHVVSLKFPNCLTSLCAPCSFLFVSCVMDALPHSLHAASLARSS